jgi:hypothetical protein
VQLPPDLAQAAVEKHLSTHRAKGSVIFGPCDKDVLGFPLTADQWAIRVDVPGVPLQFSEAMRLPIYGKEIYRFPRYTIVLSVAASRWLLRALESVKPDERDAEGRPLPWVPAQHRVESLGATERPEDDAVLVAAGTSLPDFNEPPPTAAGQRTVTDEQIRAWFAELAALAGFSPPPALSITRGTVHKHGLTTGRVWFSPDFRPLRVHLTTCPNSDEAEILETIAHELSHPLSRSSTHGDEFKRTLLDLVERRWGAEWFVGARSRLADRYDLLDAWVATSIRAALRGAEPARPRDGDDGQLARVVTRIRKLRQLGTDQLGLPEGIAATSAANDLVTTNGLGGYGVRLDAAIDDQMIDRWVLLEDDARWRSTLTHLVGEHFDVFSLHMSRPPRMHLFGRYADVVGAEYVVEIISARVVRECERHLAQWRRGQGALQAGETIREKTSFCEAAVTAFGEKLRRIAREEARASGERQSVERVRAEEFARVEHEKRGSSWQKGGRRERRENEAGRKLGGSLEIVRGLSSEGGPAKQLPGRR